MPMILHHICKPIGTRHKFFFSILIFVSLLKLRCIFTIFIGLTALCASTNMPYNGLIEILIIVMVKNIIDLFIKTPSSNYNYVKLGQLYINTTKTTIDLLETV